MKKSIPQTIVLVFITVYMMIMSSEAKAGAADGLGLCENIIIPSLLPILILVNIGVKSKTADVLKKIFGKLFEKVLKLPGCCAAAVIFGAIGGYPSGAILTEHLYEQGQINSSTAARIMSFNFSGGIAFLITAVGTMRYNNTKIGVVFFAVSCISSLIICAASAFVNGKAPDNSAVMKNSLCFTDALVESVEAATKSIINMSAYIILFSAIARAFKINDFFAPLMEITNGVCGGKKLLALPECAAFLSFGGFCIHFQLIGSLRKMRVKYSHFLLGRVSAAAISYWLMKAYLYFVPQSSEVFSNISGNVEQKYTQVNSLLSVVMIIGCVALIFDISNKKIKLH